MIHGDADAALAAQEAIAQRFAERFLIHLARLRQWFIGVGSGLSADSPYYNNADDSQWLYVLDITPGASTTPMSVAMASRRASSSSTMPTRTRTSCMPSRATS